MYKTTKDYVARITTITHEFDHFIKSPKTINICFAAKVYQEKEVKILKWNYLKGGKKKWYLHIFGFQNVTKNIFKGLMIKGLYFLFNL